MGTLKTAAKAVLLSLLLLSWAPLWAQVASSRTVTVKIALDRGIPDPASWRYQANRFIAGGFRIFAQRFGLRLVIEDFVRWQPDNGKKSLAEELVDLRTKVQPGGRDIVLGVISPDRVKPAGLGIASYPHGYILICNVGSVEAMRYAFLHELCHIFGAIDLKEKGSVMGIVDPGFEIDEFTARGVLLHKGRSFDRVSFPLPKDALDAAVSHYRQRALRELGEPQTKLFLTLLYMEKNDLESAAKACGEAADADPGFIGLHVLLGNIFLRQNRTEMAVSEYGKALRVQPGESGIHFNLGLAYIQKQMFKEAADECAAAIGINPNYVRARVMLARLRLAAGDSAGAAIECRAALKCDPQSAEALCILGTALVAISRPFLPSQEMGPAANRGEDTPVSMSPGEAVSEAIPLLRKSIILNPNDPEAHTSLGSAYAVQRSYQDAEAEFLRALAISPDDLDAHFNLGSVYLEMGDVGKAALHLGRIMAIDPRSDLATRIIAQAFQLRKTYTLIAKNPER